jgi:hypothetical protein
MTGRMLAVMAVLFALCSGLVATWRLAGRTAVATPTYLDSGVCDLPCWMSLQPGRDNVNQFMWHARERSPYTVRTSDYGDGVAVMVELSTWGAISLADVVREFGPPEQVSCLDTAHSSLYPGKPMVTAAWLYFAGGLVVANAVRPDQTLHLAPDMAVRSIRYYAPGEPLYEIGSTTGWRGFAGTARYPACHPRQRP